MKKIFTLFFSGLISLIATAQRPDYSFLTISKEFSEGADAVLRNYEEVFSVESAGKGIETVKFAYTILNKEGAKYARLDLMYDKFHSIKSFDGKMYDAFGKQIDRLRKAEIKDQGYWDGYTVASDDRYKIAKFENGQYPYTVEFEYEIIHNGLMFYPEFEPQSSEKVAVEKALFQVIMPVGMKLRYKEKNIGKVGITTSATNKNTYEWKVEKLAVIKAERKSPPFMDRMPFVITAPNDFEIDGYKGNMASWENLGKFINQLNTGRDVLSEATQAKIRNMTANSPGRFEKVKKIYEYMQSKTRYVSIQLGIGGWQPMPAQEVDEKGYGDCKALSNYMKALLKVSGIESHYTLVYAGRNGQNFTPRDFPSSFFNHAILCVPLDKDTIWLECTSQTQPAGFLGNFTDNRNVLIVTPAGGKLIRTPKYKQIENTQIRSAEVKVLADGNATVESKTVYSGLQQDANYLGHYVTLSKDEQKKWLDENLDIPQYELLSFKFDLKKDRIPVVTETLGLKINNFGAKAGKRIFITPNLMNKTDAMLPENEERKSEIVLSNFEYTDTDTIRYHIPENYHLEGTFNDVQYKSAFGEYSVKVKVEQGLVTYIRTFSLRNGRFPKEKYKELTEFFKNVTKSDKAKIVFVSNT